MCRDCDCLGDRNGNDIVGRVGNDNDHDIKDGYNHGQKVAGVAAGEQGGGAGAAAEAASGLDIENGDDNGIVID